MGVFAFCQVAVKLDDNFFYIFAVGRDNRTVVPSKNSGLTIVVFLFCCFFLAKSIPFSFALPFFSCGKMIWPKCNSVGIDRPFFAFFFIVSHGFLFPLSIRSGVVAKKVIAQNKGKPS